MKKPSERILEICNANKVLANKPTCETLEFYECAAIAQFLDEYSNQPK